MVNTLKQIPVVIKVNSHEGKQSSSIFYFKCAPEFIYSNKFLPYDTVVLKNESEDLEFIGHLEIDKTLEENVMIITASTADSLKLKTGDPCLLTRNQIVPVAGRCHLMIEESQAESSTDEEPLKDYDRKNVINTIRYHPLVQGSIIRVSSRSYRVKLYPESNKYAFIGTDTHIKFTQRGVSPYTDCIGLQGPLNELRSIIDWPLQYPETFKQLGLIPPKGVLLYGPPGCGKTHLVRTLARQSGRHFIYTAASRLQDKYVGESEKKLRNMFEVAKSKAPSIVFIDEIESLAGKRDSEGARSAPWKVSLLTELLNNMDGMQPRGDVVVIAATNLRSNLDTAVTRPGRFDREVRVVPPNQANRKKLLTHLLKTSRHQLDIDLLAKKLVGYSPADLILFVKETKLMVASKIIESKQTSETTAQADTLITMKQAYEVMSKIRPTLLRGLLGGYEDSDVTMDDIGGYEKTAKVIRDHLLTPNLYPEFYKKSGLSLPKGAIFYGPPGTGKTTMAKAIARTLGYNLIIMNVTELSKCYYGQSEKTIRDLFEKARDASPVILVLDQIDAVCQSRRRGDSTSSNILSTILSELDGTRRSDGVIVIGTTNKFKDLDKALLRSGRLELHLELDYPKLQELKAIFLKKTSSLKIEDSEACFKEISKLSKAVELSGADVMAIVRDALTYNLGRADAERLKTQSHPDVILTVSDFKAVLSDWQGKKSRGGSATYNL